MASELDNLITQMKITRINNAAKILPGASPYTVTAQLNGSGLAPGRRVYDSVSGQWVTVVGSAVAYLPKSVIEGA